MWVGQLFETEGLSEQALAWALCLGPSLFPAQAVPRAFPGQSGPLTGQQHFVGINCAYARPGFGTLLKSSVRSPSLHGRSEAPAERPFPPEDAAWPLPRGSTQLSSLPLVMEFSVSVTPKLLATLSL
jgi:hypothetical protein